MDNKFDPRNFSKEQLQQAAACETPEELAALAKGNGIEMTEEQAKKYFAEMENLEIDLSDDQMKAVAGGTCDINTSDGKCTWYYH